MTHREKVDSPEQYYRMHHWHALHNAAQDHVTYVNTISC